MMREIEQFYSTQIEEMPMFVPSRSFHCCCRIADYPLSLTRYRNVADLI